MDPASTASAISKAGWRLTPFLCLLYLVNYLDRVNVGFASLTMNASIGLSTAAYGFGAGIFFVGYVAFEVPSNLLLANFGARRWIARIMITWGLLSAAMCFANGPYSFYALRFLLGVAEAGFFPGIIYYLTQWFPAANRARMISLFMVGMPASSMLGAPISAFILDGMNGVGGLAGWQWLFVMEGLPAVVLGFACLKLLADRPADVAWLTPAERTALQGQLDRERAQMEAVRHYSVWEGLSNRRVLLLSLMFFLVTCGTYGSVFWIPQIVNTFGVSHLQNGFITALPYLLSVIVMVVWSRHSDATKERAWHVALPIMLSALGFFVAGLWLSSPVVAMAGLSAACIGIYATLPVFWTLPTSFLTGRASAGALALITSIGNISGILAPPAVGEIQVMTGSFAPAMIVLCGVLLAAACIALAFRPPQSEAGPSGAPGYSMS